MRLGGTVAPRAAYAAWALAKRVAVGGQGSSKSCDVLPPASASPSVTRPEVNQTVLKVSRVPISEIVVSPRLFSLQSSHFYKDSWIAAPVS